MENKKERQERKKSIKKIKEIIIWVATACIIGYGIFWLVTLPKLPESEVISQHGIHYHPNLSITIKGEPVKIPAGIGLGAVHNPMHTHDADGTIHLEYSGITRIEDTRLGKFFEIWGEDFTSISILGNVNGEGGTVGMVVNGVENFDFENYLLKDGDIIEIIYE